MSENISRDEFETTIGRLIDDNRITKAEVLDAIRGGTQSINAQLSVISQKVTAHGEAIAVLNDRSVRDVTARIGAGIGAGIASLVALWTAIKP